MLRTTKIFLAVAFCVLAGFKLNVGKTARAADNAILTLKMQAVDDAVPGSPRAGNVDFVIERWTSESEREGLRAALTEGDSQGLVEALHELKPRAGYVRGSGGLGWDIQYAREEASGASGSRHIVFATDRPKSMGELIDRPLSSQYDFTIGEMWIGEDGKGEGKLVTAARVSFNKETQAVEIEQYAKEPVRLVTVAAEQIAVEPWRY